MVARPSVPTRTHEAGSVESDNGCFCSRWLTNSRISVSTSKWVPTLARALQYRELLGLALESPHLDSASQP